MGYNQLKYFLIKSLTYTKRNKKNSKILNNVHIGINNRTINNACDIEIDN